MAVDITPSALLEFAKTIKSGDQKSASSSVATVTRIDPDGVTYVSLPSGVDETPIATAGTVYNVGDTVYVTRSGGKLRANDNLSSPSVGARVIKEASESLSKAVRIAKQAADEAGKVANAVNQHFWYDDNGAHVTDVTKDEWAAAVADNFSDLSDDKQYPNLLENSLGILLRSALNYLVSITRSAIAFYDGLGNTASNIVAQFGTDGAQIGKTGESHIELDYHSLQLIDKEGDAYFHVSDLRDAGGRYTETIIADGSSTKYYLTGRSTSTDYVVKVDGAEMTSGVTKYTGYIVFSSAPAADSVITVTYIYDTTYSVPQAMTFGNRDDGNIGPNSCAFGMYNVSSGLCSTSFGENCEASGYTSAAFGTLSVAKGYGAFAAGATLAVIGSDVSYSSSAPKALGDASAAFCGGVAKARWSAALNMGTVANGLAQTALGRYNVEDTASTTTHPSTDTDYGTYAVIVGNGTADDARSNAFAIDWSGRPYIDDEPCYPCFMTTSISNFSPSISPCLVLDTSDYGLYWYTS